MLTAYSYSRYSSDKQSPLSIEQQQSVIREYAEKHGYVIVHEYADAAISGKSSSKRPQYQAMRKAIQQGTDKIDAVIIFKLDRLSRNLGDFATIMEELASKDVALVSTTENLDCTTAAGKLFLNLKALLASFYIDNMSEDIMRSMLSNSKEGKFNGGVAPFGYYIQDRQYCINPEESLAVKCIFDCYAQGFSYGEILEQLNIRGTKTRSGKDFSKVGIYDILRKEIYSGTYVWNRQAKKQSNRGVARKKKPDDQVVRIPNAVPAIVDQETYDIVRQRLADQTKNSGRGKAKELYLLTKKAYCADCGYALEGNSKTTSDGNRYATYRCSHRHSTTFGCRAKELTKSLLEAKVMKLLEDFLLNEGTIPTITAALNQRINQDSTSCEQDIVAKVQPQIKKLEQERTNIINAIAATGFDQTFTGKLAEINSALEAAKALLKHDDSSQSVLYEDVTEDMVHDLFRQGYINLHKGTVPALRRLIETFLERVEVGKTTITVTFKVTVPAGTDTPYHHVVQIDRQSLKSSA